MCTIYRVLYCWDLCFGNKIRLTIVYTRLLVHSATTNLLYILYTLCMIIIIIVSCTTCAIYRTVCIVDPLVFISVVTAVLFKLYTNKLYPFTFIPEYFD